MRRDLAHRQEENAAPDCLPLMCLRCGEWCLANAGPQQQWRALFDLQLSRPAKASRRAARHQHAAMRRGRGTQAGGPQTAHVCADLASHPRRTPRWHLHSSISTQLAMQGLDTLSPGLAAEAALPRTGHQRAPETESLRRCTWRQSSSCRIINLIANTIV